MKVVTICGSMKFAEQMIKIAFDLEVKHTFAVLQCVYNQKDSEIEEADYNKLGKIHKKKIEISDAIYMVNIDGYIGDSTNNEIKFALSQGKEVIYHEPA